MNMFTKMGWAWLGIGFYFAMAFLGMGTSLIAKTTITTFNSLSYCFLFVGFIVSAIVGSTFICIGDYIKKFKTKS